MRAASRLRARLDLPFPQGALPACHATNKCSNDLLGIAPDKISTTARRIILPPVSGLGPVRVERGIYGKERTALSVLAISVHFIQADAPIIVSQHCTLFQLKAILHRLICHFCDHLTPFILCGGIRVCVLTRWRQVKEPGQSGSMLPSSTTVLQKGYYAMVQLVLGVDEASI